MLGTFDPLCFKLIFNSNKFVPSRKFIIQEFVKRGSTVHVMINSTYLVTDELLTFSHRPINGSGQKKPYLGHRFVALVLCGCWCTMNFWTFAASQTEHVLFVVDVGFVC